MLRNHTSNRAHVYFVIFGALAAILLFANAGFAAGYTLCALREGNNGPCTCRGPGDAPGQFSVVARRHCRAKAAPTKAKTKKSVAIPVLPEKANSNAAADNAAAKTEAPKVAAPKTEGSDVQNSTAVTEAPTETPQVAGASSTLAAVRARGKLRCGVNTGLLGFSAQGTTGEWEGIDADFCRAVAAAVLGNAASVEFVPLTTPERFKALSEDKVDLLSRNTTWTMKRVVELHVEFVGVSYFDGQGFLTRQDRGLVSAQQLDGLSVCVQSGTTTKTNLEYYFAAHKLNADIQVFDDKPALIDAYTSGKCDAYTSDRSALYSDRVGFPDPQEHKVLPETISKEPLGPVVRQGDRQWIEIVRWTLAGLINAEEIGLTRKSAAGSSELEGDALRLVSGAGKTGTMLGLRESWLRDVVASVGNYGEMFDANLGPDTPLGMERGMNSLWKRGGLLYAPPMW